MRILLAVIRIFLFFALFLGVPSVALGADNLIVCDEIPAMQNLAAQLEKHLGQSSEIVAQTAMPNELKPYKNVFVYIHQDIVEPAELAFINYAKGGGKLILLHHSISSGKRKNRYWFSFLGVTLPEKPFAEGGYKYFDDADWELYRVGDPTKRIALHGTEIYLNQIYDNNRTFLWALRYTEPKSGTIFDQTTAAWKKQTEKGTVYYFMPGHRAEDFNYEPYVAELMKAAR